MISPPLSVLRAFAALAQGRNVVAAGDALGVSHAAISQQLRVLEAHLNVSLLDRSGRALKLTTEGEQLASALRGGFALMGEGVAAATGARDFAYLCHADICRLLADAASGKVSCSASRD